MQSVLSAAAAAGRLGARGREAVTKNFTDAHMAEGFLKVLEQVMS